MKERLIVLAPYHGNPTFGSLSQDSCRWEKLLSGACGVRARAYLGDGAIRPEDLDSSGCFRLPIDRSSWHLLSVDEHDDVLATVRMTTLPASAGRRRGRLPHIGESLRRANPGIDHRLAAEKFVAGLELAYGRSRPELGIIGGWAIDPDCMLVSPGASMALGAWALSRLTPIAGALCVASERHDAHGQLVRTGAVPIRNEAGESLYYDSAYGCRVGLLGFWVHRESSALRRKVDRLEAQLRKCEVLVPAPAP